MSVTRLCEPFCIVGSQSAFEELLHDRINP